MNSIFNYQTLDARLSRPTRTLFLSFKRQYMDWETLFELESILAWCTNKVEIKSLFLDSCHESLDLGLDKQLLTNMPSEKIKMFMGKLQKITRSLPCMPQTIICDLGKGAYNLGAELALACDIRLSHDKCLLSFNHSSFGLVPCSGALSTLAHIVGASHAKNWIMSCDKISSDQLFASGFCYKLYQEQSRVSILNHILQLIHQQADVARIQSKLGLLENYREQAEQLNHFANKLANAALSTEDWKNIENQDNMPAKNFSTAVKLSLVKSDPI